MNCEEQQDIETKDKMRKVTLLSLKEFELRRSLMEQKLFMRNQNQKIQMKKVKNKILNL